VEGGGERGERATALKKREEWKGGRERQP